MTWEKFITGLECGATIGVAALLLMLLSEIMQGTFRRGSYPRSTYWVIVRRTLREVVSYSLLAWWIGFTGGILLVG